MFASEAAVEARTSFVRGDTLGDAEGGNLLDGEEDFREGDFAVPLAGALGTAIG